MNKTFKNEKCWVLAVFTLLSAMILNGCATIESGSHFDKAASFADYRSFSWIDDKPLIFGAGDRRPVSPLTQRQIVKAIEDELTRKGFVYTTDRNNADFILAYTVGTHDRLETSAYPIGYRGAWGLQRYGRYYYDLEVVQHTYTEGTLGVDIFDGKTKQPVWHGWASKTIENADRRDPTPSIDKAVVALFSRFPPGSKQD